MDSIYKKLTAVQGEMKAPKNLFNKFGNYKYRNAEGICEAFKPYGQKYGLALTLSDEMVEIGGRVYVKAVATLIDSGTTTPAHISVTAYAREAENKKGMDDAQVTGATSSYARKYALNGMFLLDDTKDPDTEEYQNATRKPPEARRSDSNSTPGYPSEDEMRKACEAYYKGENRKKMLDYFGVKSISDLNIGQLSVAWSQSMKGKEQ